MALLNVIKAPDPRLKQVAKPVAEVDDAVRKILADMLETMYISDGIGLAATQVGIDKRLVVMDLRDGPNEEPNPFKMVNPEIIENSDQMKDTDEGCVSLPYQYAKVRRPAEITVRYLDEHGKEKKLSAHGLRSACIQHEIDHLDGILFIDRISSLKRNMIIRRLMKEKKANVYA